MVNTVERQIIDIRGQICPSCLLMALKRVNEQQDALRNGELELEILSDDRQATSTIPDAVINMGYRVDVRKETGHYAILIRRAEQD